jgi:phage baseplate assembly protein W
MAKTINAGYTDAQSVNESSLTTFTYRDFSLFFTKNPVTGDISTLTDVADVKRSVRNLVLTNEFDRPFHPEIASHVRDLLFQPFTAITYNLLRNRIDKVLEIYEPRAKLTRIEIDDREFQNMDNNTLSVKIFFTLLNAPTNEENVDIMLERIR